MVRKRKRRIVYCEFQNCSIICKKIRVRTSVVSWAYGTCTYRTNGKWDRVAEDMMLNFSESGHRVFLGSNALERGDLKKQTTIISVNQLNIYGAVADMCNELGCRISGCSESTGKPVAQNNSETVVMPTELSTTNKTRRTDDKMQGNMLHDYEQKFANLPDHLQLVKLCSNVGMTKTVAKGQHFTTLDDAELDKLGGSCREYTSPQDYAASKVKGWIRGNTKIGPALEIAVCHHQGRYGIETMIDSLFGDGTCSWVMIVNGTNNYVSSRIQNLGTDVSFRIHVFSDLVKSSMAELLAKRKRS